MRNLVLVLMELTTWWGQDFYLWARILFRKEMLRIMCFSLFPGGVGNVSRSKWVYKCSCDTWALIAKDCEYRHMWVSLPEVLDLSKSSEYWRGLGGYDLDHRLKLKVDGSLLSFFTVLLEILRREASPCSFRYNPNWYSGTNTSLEVRNLEPSYRFLLNSPCVALAIVSSGFLVSLKQG